MSDQINVNPQVVNAVRATQEATMSPPVIQASGAGKAYQSVSQSTAIAVQDATDYLRNMSTVSATAIGVAMAQLLATGDEEYFRAIKEAQGLVTQAASDFKTIGVNAAEILRAFPSS